MIKKIIFLIISITFFFFAFIQAKPVETELAKAFIAPSSNLVKLANLSSRYLNIILEGKTPDEVEEMKTLISENRINTKEVTDVYKNYPENFLTENTRNLIKTKNYQKLKEESLARVYNPLGIYIAPLDKDPYLFATDYALSHSIQEEDKKFEGKFYSLIHYKIKNNKDIEKLLNIQNSPEAGNIYLTGAPVHSYTTSKKSVLEINLICLISTLALIILCRIYFKSIKILIPIASSILFGFSLGYAVSSLIFHSLHVLTFVFSTSLIGISLDYSLHYFLTGNEKGFRKNLTASMLTTVFAFAMLAFSNIQVLKQIAVFTSFGLIGVYVFVIIMFSETAKHGKFPAFSTDKLKPFVFLAVFLVIITGFAKLKFNDDIKNLYTPPKKLMNAESLYQKVFNPANTEFILIKGKDTNEILEKEEELNIKNSVCLANFVSSKSRQIENQKLVKKLYEENLQEYGKFLSDENIKKIKTQKITVYDTEKFPLNSEFMLDKNTSYIMVYSHHKDSISPAKEMTKLLKKHREECLILVPAVYGILFLLLSLFYGPKNSLKIIISPLLGVLFSLGLLSLLGVKINLFHILAMFLITGFSLDYSIFRINSSDKSKDAVFMSAFSTAFSFLLLSLTSFKLVSSLGITLFIGIAASYILSLFMIKSKHG